MVFFLFLPPALSVLVLAAHFFRHGDSLLAMACLASLALLMVKRPWAARVLQAVLILAAGVWIETLVELARLRQGLGQPWLRMALILGAVAAFSLGSAWLFQTRKLGLRFGLRARAPEQS